MNGVISGSMKSKMAADGHLGITALSRVTLASAGLSCFFTLMRYQSIYNSRVNLPTEPMADPGFVKGDGGPWRALGALI